MTPDQPRVPLHNVYYLMCYAWDKLERGDVVEVGALEANTPQDLLARVLQEGMAILLKRGLDRGYSWHDEETRTPRGKIDIASTIKRQLQLNARLHCRFDDLSRDVPHNRILRSTLRRLAGSIDVDVRNRAALRALADRMSGVSDVELSRSLFRHVQLHRNIRQYAFLIQACDLVRRMLLIEPGSGHRRFHDFVGDEREMGALFESFVLGFLRREQAEWRVQGGEGLRWEHVVAGHSDLGKLPGMRTDITLRGGGQLVVVDTKFYRQPLREHRGKRLIRSGHLYQLFAYLKNAEVRYPHLRPAGLLLYASVGEDLRYSYVIQGNTLHVRSLNLDRPWRAIHEQLLSIVNEFAAN